MLNVYGNAIRRVAQTDGYFIFYNVVYKKKDKRERERERGGEGEGEEENKTCTVLCFL